MSHLRKHSRGWAPYLHDTYNLQGRIKSPTERNMQTSQRARRRRSLQATRDGMPEQKSSGNLPCS